MTDLVVRGALTTNARQRRRGLIVGGAAVLWLLLFLVLPGLLIAALAFATRGPTGEVVWDLGWHNLRRLAGWGVFGWSGNYLLVGGRTLLLAALSTAIALALAFPLCFAIAAQPRRRRLVLLALVAIPFCTNVVVRTLGWMVLFSGKLWPAKAAAALGLIASETALYPSPFAVQVGLVSTVLPMAVLPLYPSVERLDRSLIEAAQDLYGGRWAVFRHAILPQVAPGLSAAFILTFIPALGTFVVSDLLGGAKYALVGNLIQQQFGPSRDWPFGAMLSLALVLISLGGLWLLRRRRVEIA